MHCHDSPVTVQGVTEEPPKPVHQVTDVFEPQIRPPRPFRGNIVTLNGASFFRMVRRDKIKICKASLYIINKAIEAKDLKECPLKEIVPKQCHEFHPLFSKELAYRLPPH